MTPGQASARLTAAERGARSYGDVSYRSAEAAADPGLVSSAADEVSADALAQEFLDLAEGMPGLDVDAETIGAALDMVLAEAWVAECARAVKRAEQALAAAEAELAAAQNRAASAEGDEAEAAAQAAVAEAEEAVAAAAAALAAAKRRLAEALLIAADLAASMRAGLQRRHGGIQEAADSSPVRMAETEFYT